MVSITTVYMYSIQIYTPGIGKETFLLNFTDLMIYKLSEKSVRYTEYKERAESFHKATINGYNNPLKYTCIYQVPVHFSLLYPPRLLILSDVCRLARKHHIWDVALLSSLYCTQSDDGHWTARAFTPSSKYIIIIRVTEIQS